MNLKNATVKVDKYHYGAKHDATHDGGSVCWDCHDPHGDRYNGTGNIYMIHEDVVVDKDDANSDPLIPASTASPVFTANTNGSDYASNTAPFDGICNVCHSQTDYHRNNATGDHTHNIGQKCIDCHPHSIDTTVDGGAFAHGGGSTNCIECHGHDSGTLYDPDMSLPYAPGASASQGRGTFKSHSTHTELDSDDIRGPGIYCDTCHDINDFPYFNSGTDGSGDGKFDLSETDVCDSCHSSGGAFDGVNSSGTSVGAKNNWSDGIYSGSVLTAGKERWCVGCHDQGSSVIGGRQAPDVAGNDAQTYGFYVSGHGIEATECGACHGLDMNHNFDGMQTYDDAAANYKQGYRLSDVGGQAPMNIPTANDGCGYSADDYRLCFSCHNEQTLIQDSKADGVFECATNPYNNAATITTGYRNEVFPEGYNGGAEDVPANIHWDHLVDIHAIAPSTPFWDSDGDGTRDSEATCVTCHNPHSERIVSSTDPTKRMTRASLDIQWGTDGIGDYGGNGTDVSWPCFTCHGGSSTRKYYRTLQVPVLDSILLSDNNPTDPAAADADYTNSTSVEIAITYSGVAPTEMIFAENSSFTSNSTGWIPYANPYTYTLSASEGTKTVYGRLKYGSNRSGIASDSITLDETDPLVSSSALTSPNNGTEVWIQDSLHDITWVTGDITDANLKAAPISLSFSTDSGNTFPNVIATGEANDGTYQWTVAPVESTNVRVQITATDKAGNQASDSSDNDFTIEAVTPVLNSITLADNDGTDPSPAEAEFTNDLAGEVAVTIDSSKNPTEMRLSESATFNGDTDPWVPYSSTTTFTFSNTVNELKTVYCQVRNGAGQSGTQNDTITLDTVSPAVLSSILTTPNGNANPLLAEYWPINSSQTITWTSGNITDLNLGATPVSFKYSSNSGASYFITIGSDEANDGSYTWNPLPSTISFTSRVQLIAKDQAGNQSTDESDNDFKVSPPYKFIITDPGDTNTLGTLRYALNNMEDNAVIWFRLASTTNEVAEINIGADLPDITNSYVTFDGDSQQKLVGSNNPNGPEVRIKGPGAGTSADAFYFNFGADDGWIENVQIGGFRYAAYSGADNFVVLGSQFGFGSDSIGYTTDATMRNLTGILLTGQSRYAYIGAGGANKNYISCSNGTGLVENGTNNDIEYNIFGLLPDDATECANTATNISLASSGSSIRNNTMCGGGYGLNVSTSDNMSVKGNTFIFKRVQAVIILSVGLW
ncbi:MAG: hypothetical protein ACYS30_21480 [Planctomycetota bacterium]|jgi:hypothetical protein